ncbi:MAG TPA: PGPGW domain-containing protein [Rhodothermales bacterium]|nr:PGPGW domain-containing protein [Rhodothermales bacterium]
MFDRLKQHWHAFQQIPPGERFQARYRERRQEGGSPVRRYASTLGGVVLVLVGLLLLPAPGPGMLVLVPGAVLLAQGSRRAARVLDALDLRRQRTQRWTVQRWRGSSTAVRGLIVFGVLVVTAGLGLGAYHLLF